MQNTHASAEQICGLQNLITDISLDDQNMLVGNLVLAV